MALPGGLYASGRGEGVSQASLDLPYHVYTSQVFSCLSLNGSTIIVAGHERGLTIIWRGGRRFRVQPPPYHPFESEEDDIRFCPAFQQPIVHRTDIHLALAVTALSLCALPADDCDEAGPPIIAAAVCSDKKVRIFRFSSTPVAGEVERDAGRIPTATIPCRGKPTSTSIRWTGKEYGGPDGETGSAARDFDLLVAICSDGAFGRLAIARIPADFVSQVSMPFHSQVLTRPAKKVSFSPYLPSSPRHTEILVCFSSGSVSIFDPFAASSSKDDTMHARTFNPTATGVWLVTLTPGFTLPSASMDNTPYTTDRHQILDAEWVAGGRSIMVLLANRQWGIWDRFNTPDRSFDFTGYLKWSRSWHLVNAQNTLAPVNRFCKESSGHVQEHQPIEPPTGPSRGGLMVTSFHSPSKRGFDDCVCLWFNDAVYTIPNLREFCRDQSNFPDAREYAGFAPLGQKVSGAHMLPSFDPVCVRHDLVIATDTRLHLCALEPSRIDIVNAREFAREKDEQKAIRAQARANRELLAQEGLDLSGVDSSLDDMTNSINLLSSSVAANREEERREDSAQVQVVSSPIKKLSWGENRSKEFYMHESLGESESRVLVLGMNKERERWKGRKVSF